MPRRQQGKAPTGLGKALVNANYRPRNQLRADKASLHYADLTTLPSSSAQPSHLASVTDRSELDEFLHSALQAEETFEAEKQQMVVLQSDAFEARTSKREYNSSAFVSPAPASANSASASADPTSLPSIPIPRRPQWNAGMSAEELGLAERDAFLTWRRQLAALEDEQLVLMTPFEKNLEVWKQLWRVIDRCSVVATIVDARNPLLYRSEDMERYVHELSRGGKANVLVVNKADYLSVEQRRLWVRWFDKAGMRVVFWSAARASQREEERERRRKERERRQQEREAKRERGLILGVKQVKLKDDALSDDGDEAEEEQIEEAQSEDDEEEKDAVEEDDSKEAHAALDERKEDTGEQKATGAAPAVRTDGTGQPVQNSIAILSRDELLDYFRRAHQSSQPPSPVPSSAASTASHAHGRIQIGFVGFPNVGKCWAPGTMLRLFNGDVKAVETFVGGEQLMGDDGQPRIVTAGSLTHARDFMYRVEPGWEGAEPFTVNGAHILVLVNNRRAHAAARGDGWRVKWWEVGTDNIMRLHSRAFRTRAAAQAEVDELNDGWEPLEWEVSVDDFLASASWLQRRCMLLAAEAVTFNNPQLPSLHAVLTVALGGVPPTPAQVDYMAWWLGIWLADGLNRQATVTQGGAPPPDPHHHHQIFAELLRYAQLFGQPARKQFHHRSTAHWDVFHFNYYVGSVPDLVLRAYGLLHNKHVPHALLCDSLGVRQRLLAGLIDGDGYYAVAQNLYEIAAKRRPVIDSYKALAYTLGLRNSKAHAHTNTNLQTGQRYDGFRIFISGETWVVTRYCIATYKLSPQRAPMADRLTSTSLRSYSFKVTPLPQGDYYGFAVHGGVNQRFLLQDYTVTHNSSTINALMRTKRVTVGATPGKTKHFQTLNCEDDLGLCDCPGLVFPSFLASRAELVCNGVMPIDQMREYANYTAPVALMVRRVGAEQLRQQYSLVFPHWRAEQAEDEREGETTAEVEAEYRRRAEEVLNAHARMRGWMKDHGRPDESRSARVLLKDLFTGKLLYCYRPPGLSAEEVKEWKRAETKIITASRIVGEWKGEDVEGEGQGATAAESDEEDGVLAARVVRAERGKVNKHVMLQMLQDEYDDELAVQGDDSLAAGSGRAGQPSKKQQLRDRQRTKRRTGKCVKLKKTEVSQDAVQLRIGGLSEGAAIRMGIVQSSRDGGPQKLKGAFVQD